jgi:protein-tyrosine phosphatase
LPTLTDETAHPPPDILVGEHAPYDKMTRPIEFSYKVSDNFYAGEYPFKRTLAEGLPKLQLILDFGIRHFIDLTEPPDRLTSYREHLPDYIEYTRFPTVDMTVPNLQDLHTTHEIARKSEVPIYVHCKGGFDRTGVTVATFFIFAGGTAEHAKKMYIQTVPNKQRTRYGSMFQPLIERTNWRALREYERFLRRRQ